MTFFKKDELKLLWPFYLDALIASLFYIYPAFHILYFLEVGLSLFQIGLLGSAMSLSLLLFEIPTGAIADLFGRKLSTVIGMFASGVALFLIFISNSFYFLLLIYFLWGIALTFQSGATTAWRIDLLTSKKQKDLIQDVESKMYSFFSFSFLLSGFIGAFLVKYFGLIIIWPASGIAFFFAGFFYLFGKENFIRKKRKKREHVKKFISHTKKSINYSVKHHALSILLLASTIAAFVFAFAGQMIWYPFLQNLGFKDHWFGYLFSVAMISGIFVPHFIKKLVKLVGKYKTFLAIIVSLMAIFLFVTGFLTTLIPALIFFLLFFSMWDFLYPARTVLFQKNTPSKMRATITSLESMAVSLITIISFPLAGYVADVIGPQKTIFISSFMLIPIIYLYSRIKEKEV